ncbi:MAG: HD domain-containing protein [bacterium]|nr:HD domain-containing protein [bacterium]
MEIPEKVKNIIETLEGSGFEAYAVGGCVRDILLGRTPKDWDVTTNAAPEKIQELFPDSFYENRFGTVGVKTESEDPDLAVVEVTTFRAESAYSDMRHPDEVRFVKTLGEDLARRDFTVNAMALQPATSDQRPATRIIDPFGGQNDLEAKLIRAVGNPEERFKEDALRMLRAVRLATALDFVIEKETLAAIQKNASSLKEISQERIRDEFTKLVMTDKAADGIRLLEEAGLLACVLAELREGIDVAQNLHHIYTVFEHNVRALEYTARKKYSLQVRLASLLHDVGKPQTKRGEGKYATFYGHDVVGGRMTEKILSRLRFGSQIVDKVTLLVRYHLFYYNVGEVTESSVRRLLKNVGPENIEDLVKVREADRIGSGVPKAVPYKLRHFKYMVEKVSKDPISAKMLAIDGNDLMKILAIEPGPKIGLILNALLGEVLEDPAKNTIERLTERAKEFDTQSADELKKYLHIKEKKIQEEEEATRKKFYV